MKTSEVRDIIDTTLGLSKKHAARHETLGEAYVAVPKSYDIKTELLSEESKKAHFELYERYVRTLNDVSAQLDTADRKGVKSQTSQFRSLKLDETWNLNATWLHELYFANCSDVHSEVFTDSLSFMRLDRDFSGGFTGWQFDFLACGMSAQNGWAVCGYHMFLQRYVNVFIDGHDGHVPVGLYPCVVVDVWEHGYQTDYGNDRESYLRGQLAELRWGVIEERFKKAEKVAQALGA